MPQAVGSNAKFRMYREAAFGVTPGAPNSRIMPINTSELKASRNQIVSKTIRGRRDASKPSQGRLTVAGNMEVPVDVRGFGFWLQSGIGSEISTPEPAVPIDNGAAAVDVGGGVVGIPVTAHGFYAGESVVITGTVNYNGTHTVLADSTEDLVHITKAFQAESFGADDTIQVKRYTHVFKVSSQLASYIMEQGYPDIGVYQLFNGCKTNKMSLKVGEDAELVASLEIMGAKETVSGSPFDASPVDILLDRFENSGATIFQDGEASGILSEMSLALDNGLDGNTFIVGGGGVRGALNEGIAAISGSIKALFQDADLYTKARNAEPTSLSVQFERLDLPAHTLTFDLNELLLQAVSPGIPTPGGLFMDLPFQAYYKNAIPNSILVATLVNDVPDYAWAAAA